MSERKTVLMSEYILLSVMFVWSLVLTSRYYKTERYIFYFSKQDKGDSGERLNIFFWAELIKTASYMNLKTIVALSLVLCYTVTGGQVNLTIQVRGLGEENRNGSTSEGTEELNWKEVTAWNKRSHLLSDWVLVVSQAVICQHEPVLLPL